MADNYTRSTAILRAGRQTFVLRVVAAV